MAARGSARCKRHRVLRAARLRDAGRRCWPQVQGGGEARERYRRSDDGWVGPPPGSIRVGLARWRREKNGDEERASPPHPVVRARGEREAVSVCKPLRERAPNTRMKLTGAVHFGSRAGVGGREISTAAGARSLCATR